MREKINGTVNNQHLKYLDGIRGIMALNVIISHFIVVYFPQMYFEDYAKNAGGGVLSLFANTPLSILVNGNIAVQYFFVLTGFLVCRSVILKSNSGMNSLIEKAGNRYIRLWGVAAASIIFTCVTMICKMQFHISASEFTSHSTFLLDYCNFKPTIVNLLSDIFVRPYVRNSIYVGPLWTIRYEFWGYILCYVVCLSVKETKWRRIIYVMAAMLAVTQLSGNYLAFFIGAFIADIVFRNEKDASVLSPIYFKLINNRIFIAACGIIGLYFAACPIYFDTIYSVWKKIPFIEPPMLRAAGVGMLLYFIINCGILKRLLSCKVLLWFGKISYSTYAFHWPIMLTVEAGLFLLLRQQMDYGIAALAAFAITLPVIYLVSYFSWRLFEKNNRLSISCIAEKISAFKGRLSGKPDSNTKQG